jgi:polar amino acid transport system substrate-binding protein
LTLRLAIFTWLLGLSLVATLARADGLEDVRSRGELAWCGDQEGGGPYVFPRDDDPSRVTGFEVDLASHLADYLRVKPRFVQGQWDKLGGLVDARKCDLILNGYELSPERVEAFEATVPFYVYGLQLLAR